MVHHIDSPVNQIAHMINEPLARFQAIHYFVKVFIQRFHLHHQLVDIPH